MSKKTGTGTIISPSDFDKTGTGTFHTETGKSVVKDYYQKTSSYRIALNGVLLPVVPGKIQFSYKGKNETVDLIEGEINRIKTVGLTEVEFECLIPQTRYRFAVYRENKFQTAAYYLDEFEKMKKLKKPFKFKIIRRAKDRSELFDTTLYVTLEEYSVEENADNGTDLMVSVKLKQYRDYGCQTLKKTTQRTGTFTVVSESLRKQKTKEKALYTKKGDSLMKIAKKELNDSSRWKEIYELNQGSIEAKAKEYGRFSSSKGMFLFEGIKLKLPN